ncbi:hypothetical protein LXL04_011769 [Taraxacum kok-saghyz]
METLFGDRIPVPPDIGDNSQIFEDAEMKNTDEAEVESGVDDRADLHGPIKTLRQQRHLKGIEQKKIEKANYEAKMALKANKSIGKESVLNEVLNQTMLNLESSMKEDDDRNEEAKRSKTNSAGILISEELLAAINQRDSIKTIDDSEKLVDHTKIANDNLKMNVNADQKSIQNSSGGSDFLKNWRINNGLPARIDKGITDAEMSNAMDDPNLMMNDEDSLEHNSESIDNEDLKSNNAEFNGTMPMVVEVQKKSITVAKTGEPSIDPVSTDQGNPATVFVRSYAQMVEKKNTTINCNIKTITKDPKKKIGTVELPIPLLVRGSEPYQKTLIGCFIDRELAFPTVKYYVNRMWKPYGIEELMVNDEGYYFFRFSFEHGMMEVMDNRPWLINNVPIFVLHWKPGLVLSKPEISTVPVWVKVYNVPLEYWNEDGIALIANEIGKPIMMDKMTASMCENH